MAKKSRTTTKNTVSNSNGFDKTKFSFKETFMNPNGKTSATKLIGMSSSAMCIIMFIVMSIFYMFNVAESGVVIVLIDKIIQFFGISAGLMGVKSVTSSFGTNNKIVITNDVETSDDGGSCDDDEEDTTSTKKKSSFSMNS